MIYGVGVAVRMGVAVTGAGVLVGTYVGGIGVGVLVGPGVGVEGGGDPWNFLKLTSTCADTSPETPETVAVESVELL